MTTLSYAVRSDGLYLQYGAGRMALTPFTAHTIRIRYTTQPAFGDKPSLMVVAPPAEDVHFTVQETADTLLLATSAVTVAIDKRTAAFTYLDSQGRLLAAASLPRRNRSCR